MWRRVGPLAVMENGGAAYRLGASRRTIALSAPAASQPISATTDHPGRNSVGAGSSSPKLARIGDDRTTRRTKLSDRQNGEAPIVGGDTRGFAHIAGLGGHMRMAAWASPRAEISTSMTWPFWLRCVG